MGKRELLLVIGFVVAGAVLYHATAPPPPPGSEGFSVSRIIQQARRAVQGNRAQVDVESTRTEAIDASIEELHLTVRSVELAVIGEARTDVQFGMKVNSTGYDPKEARQYAEATELKIDRAGPSLAAEIKYPRQARQRAWLTVRVPSRLRVRLEPSSGRLTIANVAAVEGTAAGGPATLTNIAGPVTLNLRGVPLAVDGAASLRLTGRGVETKLQRVTGMAIVQSNGGDLTLSAITGPLEIESRNTDVRVEQIRHLKAPLRVNATNGSVRIAGLRTEARIDGNDTDLDIVLDAPAPVTIYSTSQDITVTPPAAGYTVDAVATDGRITIDDGSIHASGDTNEQRASGSVRGGGATLTLRATRGDILVRPPAGK